MTNGSALAAFIYLFSHFERGSTIIFQRVIDCPQLYE